MWMSREFFYCTMIHMKKNTHNLYVVNPAEIFGGSPNSGVEQMVDWQDIPAILEPEAGPATTGHLRYST